MVNFDKFLASFITEMKECSRMRNFSIPRCIKKRVSQLEMADFFKLGLKAQKGE